MKKLLLASALALTTSVAVASPVFIDVGQDFGNNASPQAAGDTTTGWLDSLSLVYTSSSDFVDLDDSVTLSDGDTVKTSAGFIDGDFSSLQVNVVTGLLPGQSGGGPSKNGYNKDAELNVDDGWGLTFQIEDMEGVVAGGTNQYLNYTSGDITLYYFDETMNATTDFIELFTISVANSGLTTGSGGGSFVSGSISSFGTGSVNGVDAGDVFNNAFGSFEDYVVTLPIFSVIDYNTTPIGGFTGAPGNSGHLELTANGTHDGSIVFNVPEPTSIAILGLGLLGFAGSRRRKL
jgi:hypothetical protein